MAVRALPDGLPAGGWGDYTALVARTIPSDPAMGKSLPVAIPFIIALSQRSGPTTTNPQITLTGVNFSGASSVTFGGVAAAIVSNTATQIVVELPSRPAGAATVNVVVTATAGTSPLAGDYRFTYYVKCTVTGLSPASGFSTGGDVVTITGTGFTGSSGVDFTVRFGGVLATGVQLVNSTTLRATSPAGTADTSVHVTVQNVNLPAPDNLSPETPADLFLYVGTGPVVSALSVNQSVIAGGGTTTITGSNLSGATAVEFGSGSTWVAGTIQPGGTATSLTVTIPPRGSQAQVYVRVTTPIATSQLTAASQFIYYRPVTVTSLSPTVGTDSGGTRVNVRGTGFTRFLGGTLRAFVDGVEATIFTSTITDSDFDIITPAHAAGPPVHVTVQNWRGDTSAATSADLFTYVETPSITSISPNNGPVAGGTTVTITGSNFTGATSVKFGTVNAASFTVNSDTSITATSPAWVSGTLPVPVTVTGPAGTSPGFTFTYYRPLAVTSISPNTGPTNGGTSVTILGTGFTGTTNVKFGTAPASFTVDSDTQITATSPSTSLAGAVHVTVTNSRGTSVTSTADLFTYVGGSPTITSLSPIEVPLTGGSVTLTGTNLNPGGTVTLTVGGDPVTILTNNGTTITFTAPARSVGFATVQVTTVNGSTPTGSASLLLYYAPLTVTTLTPANGAVTGGTVVTFTGTGFTSVTAVQFGSGYFGTDLNIISDTEFEVTAPAHPAGVVDVNVANSRTNLTVTGAFTFGTAPAITSLTPDEGPTSSTTTVTITGENIDTTTGVTIGGTPVSFTQLSPTTVRFTAPTRLTAGTVNVVVTTPVGTASAPFLYYAPLTVTLLDPNHGPTTGGTTVTITGTGFTGATAVTFGGSPGASLSVASDTELTVRTPARVAGAVNVVVVTPRGSSTAVTFTYEAAIPTITSVNPAFGPPGGGTIVTVNGTNLDAVTIVKIDSASVSFVKVSASQLTIRTGPHPIGAATIRVQTATGAFATFPFAFANRCRVTAVTPEEGSTLGGTRVTVTGSGFTDATDVEFDDGFSGTNLHITSDTQLEVSAPAHPAGVANVRVTNPRETSPVNSPADNFTFRAAPHISAITPNTGPIEGGTEVTLTGTDLDDVTTLRIDGATVPFTIDNPTTIRFTTPAHAAGEVWPIVLDSLGAAGSPPEPFLYYDALTITSIDPRVGGTAGGQTITVNGSGFLDATAVEFDLGNPGTDVVIISDTKLTVVSPAHALGPVHIRVTNPRGTSAATSASLFTYVPAPTIDSIDPSSGTAAGGTTVTVTGEFLTGTTAVTFGGLKGSQIIVIDDSTLTVHTPNSLTLGEVPVVVTTPGGDSTDDITYEFTNAAPTCEATATPTSGDAILGVSFAGTAADADDGLPASVLWDFGDGTTDTAAVVSHSYTTPGIYTATFTVTDRFGATASDSVTITVTRKADNQPPVAIATASVTSGDAVLDVNFDGSASYDPDGTIARYVWEFGDGSPAFTPLATHRYRLPGTYVARLTVMDNNGETDVSDTITIVVGAPPALDPPIITSIRPAVGAVGTPVVIRGQNLLEVVSCHFVPVGDTSGPAAEIVHVANDNYMTVIAPSGSGLVNVRVSNADYTSVVGPQTLFTYVPGPTAVARATPDEGCAPINVQFSSAGSSSPNGGPLKYLWEFGDGALLDFGDYDTSTDANPVHTYWIAGNYTVRLSVTDRLGVVSSTTIRLELSQCPPGEPGGPGTTPPGWPSGPTGSGGGGGGGGGDGPSDTPTGPAQYGFDCTLRSQHITRKFIYNNANYPLTPEQQKLPLFSADWSSRRLRNGIEFRVNVTVLRDFPRSTSPGPDWPYPAAVFFGAVAMTAEPGGPALSSTNLGFGFNARLLGASGVSLTPTYFGGVFRPVINAEPGEEGIFAGATFSLAIMAPPLLEIGYAQVGFQSQFLRSVGDLDIAWVAVDCDIEDIASKSGWVITDPGIASGSAFSVGPPALPPRDRRHRPVK